MNDITIAVPGGPRSQGHTIEAKHGILFNVGDVSYLVQQTTDGIRIQKKSDAVLDTVIIEPASSNVIYIK